MTEVSICTPCLSTRTESTAEYSPVKMRPSKISRQWKRFGFCSSPVCIGNLSHPERNFELLMFSDKFLKFRYFPGHIAQTIFGLWQCLIGVIKAFLVYKFDPRIQFHWQFCIWTPNFCFWLADILLRKFDASSKNKMKMKKALFLW